MLVTLSLQIRFSKISLRNKNKVWRTSCEYASWPLDIVVSSLGISSLPDGHSRQPIGGYGRQECSYSKRTCGCIPRFFQNGDISSYLLFSIYQHEITRRQPNWKLDYRRGFPYIARKETDHHGPCTGKSTINNWLAKPAIKSVNQSSNQWSKPLDQAISRSFSHTWHQHIIRISSYYYGNRTVLHGRSSHCC